MLAALEYIDIETGRTTCILKTDWHIEAPNWAPDGLSLIVAAAGRLYRVDLAHPVLELVQTDGLIRQNNDHGISPDGRWLATCDKSETGKSCIYVLPASGGAPQRVTSRVPSWWHGWSMDSASILYACVRDDVFAIAKCAVQGGAETLLLTCAPGQHCDGPEYTPDGAWIWFNSDRGGQMALWRMRADGSDPEQMTDGSRADWFPHPSPDGKYICYLSYPAGTQEHPPNRHVELRLLPAKGGEPKVLAKVFGGQGTLNVPCWAPDGKRFAYVRYRADVEMPEYAGYAQDHYEDGAYDDPPSSIAAENVKQS